MKIVELSASSFDFGNVAGIGIELENGKRHAVSLVLPADTEELPEVFAEMGKALRKWAREQEKS